MSNMLLDMGIKARDSANILSTALSSKKDKALLLVADHLEKNVDAIVDANKIDMQNAAKNGISTAMQDRLLLTPDRIRAIAEAVRDVVALPDPVGVVMSGATRPNGLQIIKKAVPLGVIGMIYESRPNVTIDSAVLCLKSGNACILRGGSEAINSNKVLADTLRGAIKESGLPEDSVQLIEVTSREAATALMQLNGYVDALIPRGGKGLIQSVVKNASVPVIETGAGNCHLYIDSSADFTMALNILYNAKISRPSVCNAVETLLVHHDIADEFIPLAAEKLTDKVELRGCQRTMEILGDKAKPATDEDWWEEYNDYILAVKVVEDTSEAIAHIGKYSTQHSETIVTESYKESELFLNSVDSATVYVNASSRFTDGGEFGLGAEIGISTQKMHVRGPMGLSALTSYKYIVRGDGQIRE